MGGGTQFVPTDEERARLKTDHKIGWHKRGGWYRRFPGTGKRTYFGKIKAAQAIKACVKAEDRLNRGETEDDRPAVLTVRQAVNFFLNNADKQLSDKELGVSQRAKYGRELHAFTEFVGKDRLLSDFCRLDAPDELFRPLRAHVAVRGIHALDRHVTIIRTFLDWCSNTRRYIAAPFYADQFARPKERQKRSMRKAERGKKGEATWAPGEVRQIVTAAKATDAHRHAWVLLMLNGAMGAMDLAQLLDSDVDWDRSCIVTERSKTLVPRVVPLWPETVVAMQRSRAQRVSAAEPQWGERFFLTPRGRPLVHEELSEHRRKMRRSDAVKDWFRRLMSGTELKYAKSAPRLGHLKRPRAGSYTLRSVFRTLAAGQPSDLVSAIMGHEFENPVDANYLRGDLLDRLRTVVDYVHEQIWPDVRTDR